MGLFSSITSSLINPTTLVQLATGPAGWASLAAKMIVSAVGQQVIQALGQKLGLPQGAIDIAKTAFSSATGGDLGGLGGLSSAGGIAGAVSQVGDSIGMSQTDQGSMVRDLTDQAQSIADKLFTASREGSDKAKAEEAKSGKNGAGGNWLRAIAEVMAQSMDDKITEMQSLAQAYDGQSKDNKSTQTMTDLQVATQEFSYLMQSTTNMIKTIGEGLSTMARKG